MMLEKDFWCFSKLSVLYSVHNLPCWLFTINNRLLEFNDFSTFLFQHISILYAILYHIIRRFKLIFTTHAIATINTLHFQMYNTLIVPMKASNYHKARDQLYS